MTARALIFAAGRGERMRPLTDALPKPLLPVRGKPMIVRHIEALARAGVSEIVVNTSHLAARFPETLGDGSRWNLRIRYSYEGPQPLDSGGGMLRALPLLGHDPFIAVNGDIVTDFDFATLPRAPVGIAHLVVIDNPPHHPDGDFVLREGRLHDEISPRLTFSGIGVYRPTLLDHCVNGAFSMVPILREAMRRGAVSGEHYRGAWSDVGTPQRLADINGALSAAG